MKKVLSIVLSICLIVTSISAVLTQSVSASDATSWFHTASNWFCTGATTGLGTDTATKAWGSVSTDTAHDCTGDGTSLNVNAYAHYATITFDVTAYTNYDLSFSMFHDGEFTNSSKYMISTAGITTVGGSVATTSTDTLSPLIALDKTQCQSWYSANTWHNVSLKFNSGNNTKLVFFIRYAGANDRNLFFVDDFQLNTGANAHDFESLGFWGKYAASGSVLDGNGIDYNITLNRTADYCYNGTGTSIKFANNLTHHAVALPDLKTNTKYVLSMKFLVRTATTSSSQFFVPIIFKPGYETSGIAPTDAYMVGDAPNPKNGTGDGAWHDYSIEFTTDDTTMFYFSIGTRLGGTIAIYFDEFNLEEIPKSSVTLYDGTNVLDTLKGYEGEALTLPTPTKTGYDFLGWYTDAECTTEFTATTFTAEDITLYAKWDKVDTFEILTNWGTYANNAVVDGSSVATGSGWPHVAINTNASLTATNSGKSVKANGNITHSAVAISGLKAYTSYTLTFKYMIPTATKQYGTNPWVYFNIVKKNTTVVGNMQSDIAYHTTSNEALNDGTWREVTLNFTTDATTDYFFTSYGRFGGGYNYYLDEFVLTEGETYTPVTITFDTNGGDAIEPLDTKVGETVTVPDATKTDKVFAGWYTDDTLTTAFDGTALDSDFTLYADWADYKITKESGVLIKEFADTPLHQWASYGDIVNLSFDYRLVSGDAAFYPITSNNSAGFNQAKWYYDNNGTATSKTAINGFTYKSNGVNEGSSAWQNYSATYSVRAATNIDGQYSDKALTTPITVEDFLGYVCIYFTKGGDTESTDDLELYISNVNFEATGKTNSLDAGWENRAAICAAENSTTGQNGLRVYNEVNTAWFEDADIVEYGSIVTYETLLDGALTLATVDAKKAVKGIAYSKEDNKELTFTTTDNGSIYTSYLININPEYFAKNIVIRTYAIDSYGKVYYDNGAFKLCVYDAIYAMDIAEADANGNVPSDFDKAVYKAFVEQAGVDNYIAWCEKNIKEFDVTTLKMYNEFFSANA